MSENVRSLKKSIERLTILSEHIPSADLKQLVGSITDQLNLVEVEVSNERNEANHYRQIVDSFPNPIFEEDFSGIIPIIESISHKGPKELRIYLNNHPEIVRRITDSVSIDTVNLSAKKLYGVSEHEPFYPTLEYLVVEDSYPDFIDQILSLYFGADYVEQEMQNYNEKGNIVHLILTMAVIDRERYGLSRVLVTVTDISPLKQTQQQKEQLERRLTQAKKMEALGLLAGGVAHDLNNVLVGVVSYPDMLLLDMKEDDPLREPMELIKQSGLEASFIVQDLLSLSRRGAKAEESIDLRSLLEDLENSPEFMTIASRYPQIRFSRELDDDLFRFRGSGSQVRKMLLNLFLNAFEAQPYGGLIKVRASNEHLGPDSTPLSGDVVTITVSDHGVGLDSADIERIYEPFYTKKVMGRSGTGLGMTVVWGTVQDLGGHIAVTSKRGEGTEFRIQIPAADEKETIGEAETTGSPPTGVQQRILIVDDMETQRNVAVNILNRLGYQAVGAPSGPSAADLIREGYRPDLLVLDMLMPELDGLETFKLLRTMIPEVPTIIVSGYAESERVDEAMELGVRRFIRKPYTIESLGNAVGDLLGAT